MTHGNGSPRLVTLGEVATATSGAGSPYIYRRDGRDVDMVLGDLAGAFEAPIYGMGAVDDAIGKADWTGTEQPKILLNGQPTDETHTSVLWDGE